MNSTDLCQVYRCFCELPRLRILNLLDQGPLCVCHLQEILDEPQVKISKHLGYLKSNGLVDCVRHANWSIYSLPKKRPPVLDHNLQCLQDLRPEISCFRADLRRLKKTDTSAVFCGK